MKLKYLLPAIFLLNVIAVNLAAQVVTATSEPVYFVMLPNTDRDLPPDLYAHVSFNDDNRNGIIEAGENASIAVSIYNCGDGRAQDVTIQLDVQTSDMDLVFEKKEHTIPAIFPNGTFQIIFPFKAGKAIKSMEHKVNIKIMEKFGYDFETIKLKFNAVSSNPAKMEFTGIEIIDFGDQTTVVETDGRIQVGERVKLRLFIQNTDKGIARNVTYEVSSKNKNLQVASGKGSLEHLAYGEMVDFLVYLKVNKNYIPSEGDLPLFLTVNVEGNNGGFSNFQLPIQLEKPAPAINMKNLGKELEAYVSKYAVFTYTSNNITTKIGSYVAPTFTSNIKNATAKALGGGYIIPSKDKVIARGACWSSTPNPTLENNYTIDGNGAGMFRSTLSGLKPNTTYYTRTYATYVTGVVYGNQISFTTLELPTVLTTKPSAVGASTTMSGGTINSDGGAPITERGVCWSPSENPTIANNKMTSGSGIGSFTTKMTMLSASTKYFARAYAINAAGVAYGDQITFTTTPSCDNIKNLTYGGQNYQTIEVGNQCWLRDNLNVGTYVLNQTTANDHSDAKNNGIVEKYCYDNKEDNCVLFGGLYDWSEMMMYQKQEEGRGICPEGWHVPTLAEWNTLIAYFGGETVAGTPVKKAGSSGFEALAGGLRGSNGNFNLQGSGAYFWTSTQIDEGNAWGVSLLYRGTALSPIFRSKNMGLSVRCIKD